MSSYTPSPLVPKGSKSGKTTKSSGPSTKSYGSVTHYTMQEAQGFALKAFQDAIGRAPTSDELNNFLASFNAGQRAQTTTTTTGAGGSFSSTTGGVDETLLAQQIAQQNPEYAGYQKATTYFDAFNQVMNSRGGTGL
jgi:hypothetical protein